MEVSENHLDNGKAHNSDVDEDTIEKPAGKVEQEETESPAVDDSEKGKSGLEDTPSGDGKGENGTSEDKPSPSSTRRTRQTKLKATPSFTMVKRRVPVPKRREEEEEDSSSDEESEEEGVYENQPTVREGVLRYGDQKEEPVPTQGSLRHALSSLNESVEASKKRVSGQEIRWAQDEGVELESTPQEQHPDVVRHEEGPTFQKNAPGRGHAKRVLSKYQKSLAEKEAKKEAVVINPEDGEVVENEPTELEGVYRDEGSEYRSLLPEGKARSLREKFIKGDVHNVGEKPKREITPPRLGQELVVENEPAKREGVITQEDKLEEVLPMTGAAKNIKEKFANWNDQPKTSRRSVTPPMLGQEVVVENEPIERDDVVKAGPDEDQVLLTSGQTKLLKEKWANMEKESSQRESRRSSHSSQDSQSYQGAVGLPEAGHHSSLKNKFAELAKNPKEYRSKPVEIGGVDTKTVYESEPVLRPGVVRHDDEHDDDMLLASGATKSKAEMWKNIDTSYKKEARSVTPPLAEGPVVYENEPTERDDVYRPPDDLEDQFAPKRGGASSMKDKFLQQANKEFRKEDAQIEVNLGAQELVVENQPAETPEEIAKHTLEREEILPKRGAAKKALKKFKKIEQKSFLVDRPRHDATDGMSGPWIDDGSVPSPGTTSSLTRMFSSIDQDHQSAPQSERHRFTPPRDLEGNIMETEYVVENEPEVRNDLLKEGMDVPLAQVKEVFENAPNVRSDVYREGCDLDYGDDKDVYENTPEEREDLLRESDPTMDELQQLKKLGESRRAEYEGVYENEPEEVPGLIRESDAAKEVMARVGSVKSKTKRFRKIHDGKSVKQANALTNRNRKPVTTAFGTTYQSQESREEPVEAPPKAEPVIATYTSETIPKDTIIESRAEPAEVTKPEPVVETYTGEPFPKGAAAANAMSPVAVHPVSPHKSSVSPRSEVTSPQSGDDQLAERYPWRRARYSPEKQPAEVAPKKKDAAPTPRRLTEEEKQQKQVEAQKQQEAMQNLQQKLSQVYTPKDQKSPQSKQSPVSPRSQADSTKVQAVKDPSPGIQPQVYKEPQAVQPSARLAQVRSDQALHVETYQPKPLVQQQPETKREVVTIRSREASPQVQTYQPVSTYQASQASPQSQVSAKPLTFHDLEANSHQEPKAVNQQPNALPNHYPVPIMAYNGNHPKMDVSHTTFMELESNNKSSSEDESIASTAIYLPNKHKHIPASPSTGVSKATITLGQGPNSPGPQSPQITLLNRNIAKFEPEPDEAEALATSHDRTNRREQRRQYYAQQEQMSPPPNDVPVYSASHYGYSDGQGHYQ